MKNITRKMIRDCAGERARDRTRNRTRDRTCDRTAKGAPGGRWGGTRFTPGDLLGGVTAAVISLPMALAFGTVSGLGAQAGLYGAVIVGLVAACVGGSRILMSEPTGPMTVMMAAIVAHSVGSDDVFAVIILAGLMQIVFGKLRMGRFVTMMPYGVISGFMSGIGVLLVLQQFPRMVGMREAAGVAQVISWVIAGDLRMLIDPQEAVAGLIVFLMLVGYPRRLRGVVPPHLAAVLAGLLLVLVLPHGESLQTVGTLPSGLPVPRIPLPSWDTLPRVLVDAALLALLGSIDTLLTATIADNLTGMPHDSDGELVGQGAANMLSGVFGGLPGAGATMGTVVAIQAGARTPLAGIIRAGTLVLAVALASPVIASIPVAVLSAIAVKVGIDILDWSFLGRAHRISRKTTVLMYLVLALTVFVDLIVAVGVGVFLANILTIDHLSRSTRTKVQAIGVAGDPVYLTPGERELLSAAGDRVLILEMSGPMIFGVAQALARERAALTREVRILIIDLEAVSFVGTTIALLLENVVHAARANETKVALAVSSETVIRKLEVHEPIIRHVVLHPDRMTAVRWAATNLV